MRSLDELIQSRRTNVEYLDKLRTWSQDLSENSVKSQSSTASALSALPFLSLNPDDETSREAADQQSVEDGEVSLARRKESEHKSVMCNPPSFLPD